MIDLGTIGALNVLIGGDNTGLVKALQQSDAAINKHTKSFRDALNGVAKYALGVTAAGAALVTGLVAKSMQSIDAQAKLTRQLRATSQGLETLTRAADLAGIEKEQMIAAVRKLDVAIGQAAGGNKEYAETFARLGLSVNELANMDADKRVMAINEAIQKNIPVSERAAIAAQLFSKRMGSAIASLAEDDIRTAREEVQKLGLAVDEVDAATIERANDQLSTMSEVVRGAANRFAVALAPIIDDVSQRIRQAALDTNGFKDTIDAAFTNAIKLAAKAADVIRGLQVVLKATELAFQTFGHAIIGTIAGVAKGYTEIANLLPGIDINFDDTFLGVVFEQSKMRVQETKKELEDLANLPMPGEGLLQWFETIKKTSLAASQEMVRARKAATGTGKGDGGAGMSEEDSKRLEAIRMQLGSEFEQEKMHHDKLLKELQEFKKKRGLSEQQYNELVEKETDRHNKALADMQAELLKPYEEEMERKRENFEQLREQLLDEEQLEQEHHAAKLIALQEALDLEITTRAEYQELIEQAEEQHLEKLKAIREAKLGDLAKFTKWTFTQQTSHVLGELSKLTAGAARENRAMFEANKIFGIADAAVNAYIGISKTLAAYPYPLNIGMAAAHGIAAFAQINEIRKQTFGSGSGAAPSLAGSTPAIPVSPVGGSAQGSGSGQASIINLHGEFFTRKQIRNLLEGLNEEGRDGGQILVNG